jgi:hypothetical protein
MCISCSWKDVDEHNLMEFIWYKVGNFGFFRVNLTFFKR